MKKLDVLKESLTRGAGLFRCPYCKASLSLAGNAWVCTRKHTFDLAAKGYCNLAPGKGDFYDAPLFAARRDVFARGFFTPLYEALDACAAGRNGLWLDAGCGEGSGLRAVGRAAGLRVGVDLAKDGIQLAASGTADSIVWLVGDLARLPLADETVAVLLNVLSPANYAEFTRVLAPGGLVMKVIPGESYLQELRTSFYDGTEAAAHSAENTAEVFRQAFPGGTSTRVQYTIHAEPALLALLADMTPLGRNVSAAAKAAFARDAKDITADFIILSNM